MTIALVAAQSENRVIGRGLEIPWKVKGEQALFKQITIDSTLIMGRKTYDSIGRALPGRTTIVVSRNVNLAIDGCCIVQSLEDAIVKATDLNKPIFIAGGGELYRQALPIADAIHLTTIHTTIDGDVLFPEIPGVFKLISEKPYSSNIDYTYRYYERSESSS